MNELTISKYEQAEQLHSRIIASGQVAADALLELCRCLKQMKDEKLYVELGYSEFEEYCTEKAGIKARMADYYISTYERLGSTVLQNNAGLGITKLSLIAGMNPIERTELLDSGELADKSVAEIKEIVAKSKDQGEQISLLEEKLKSAEEKAEDSEKHIDYCENRIAELETELKELKNAPVEVAVEAMSDEEKDKIRKDIEKEVRKSMKDKEEKKIQAAVDKAVAAAEKDAVEKGKKEAEKQLEDQISELKSAVAQSRAAAEEAEKKLKLSDNTVAKANVYFEAAQESINKMLNFVKGIENEEQREKLLQACRKLLDVAKEATEQ